jgi:hypothetical protein
LWQQRQRHGNPQLDKLLVGSVQNGMLSHPDGNPILRALATLTRAVAYLIALLIVATVLPVFFLLLTFATTVL